MTLLDAVLLGELILEPGDSREAIAHGFVTINGKIVNDPDHVLVGPSLIRAAIVRARLFQPEVLA